MHSSFSFLTGPPLPPYHPVVNPILSPVPVDTAAILKHIEYYFSNDNLVKDTYLRRHMDAEGWVPAALIAGFNQIRLRTYNISDRTKYILDLVQNSERVEVRGEKIRRRGDWKTWILPVDTQANGGCSSALIHGCYINPVDQFRGPALRPYYPHVHAISSPVPMDAAAILKHIEYYFSNENLAKDIYLRNHMDAEGWVPAAFIAGTIRIRQMTHNISDRAKFILDLAQNSEIVEVLGEKIRRRGDWRTWILPVNT